MDFKEALEQMKNGKVVRYMNTKIRAVKITEEWRGETLSTSWKLEHLSDGEWLDLPAIKTSCLLEGDWVVNED